MLSPLSRQLTFLTAALYTLLGTILFIVPAQMAPNFAWNVSAFVTMTIGAWCLGNAWLAWVSARRWQWPLIYTTLIYLWLFGLLELAVLVGFRQRLQLGHPIAWLYIVTLIVNSATAVVSVLDWLRRRPAITTAGPTITVAMRAAAAAFVLFVLFLAIYGLLAGVGSRGTNGGIFPEVMSLFTLRSFAVFYLALALSAIPLIFARSLATLLHHAYASYGLVILITIATFVYLNLFDFAARPLGLLYIGAYVLVALVTGGILLRYGTGFRRRPVEPAPR